MLESVTSLNKMGPFVDSGHDKIKRHDLGGITLQEKFVEIMLGIAKMVRFLPTRVLIMPSQQGLVE